MKAQAATVAFVQVNYAGPQAAQTSVPVIYTKAQTAGDLNVVVVGWNDSTAQVSSVKDSMGNVYTLAVGPSIQTGLATQAIYYASNIAAAAASANTVTVTFTAAAAYPDIRIAEYSGIATAAPVDVVAAAQGSSTSSSSGSVTTKNANDLLIGANLVQTTTTAAGSGFTSRVITSPDADIFEDQVVTATGNYSATATLASGSWIMQMAAFRASGTSPTVSSISPNSGSTAGGTAVTITGTNFATGASVTFGTTAATNVVVVNGTTITATTPAGSAGAVTVTVTVSGQSGSLTNGFTYALPPTVSSVSPTSGTTTGGTPVTITGTNFAAGATVTFGTAAATNVVVVSSTSITATTPAGTAGAATVTVTVGGQSGSLTSGFMYIVTPTVNAVSPNTGTTAGGTAVTITGTNFAAGATVTFGTAAATNVVVVSSTSITATSPAGTAGAATVTVTVNGQSGSLASGFTYIATPTVSSVSPNTGSTTGGTAVTITGTNFVTGATVTFGATAATNVVVVNATTITATTPAGTAGATTVMVTIGGQSGSLSSGFTYAVITPTTISYVQGNYATPQTSQTTVSVTFTGAQTTGDLNVVAVGWNNSASTISAVTDKSGNTYIPAVGPTAISGVASQSIYYAKNIAAAGAGANIVTVTFSSSTPAPDVRILEYSGADPNNPVDVTAAASGTSATSSSGSVNTTNATDLLFGANYVETSTTGPGTGFTQRMLTTPDGDIAEDEMVTTTGSYAATAPLSSGWWIMQMVAFRTPTGGATVPTVSSISPNSGPTVGGTVVTIAGANFASGATVTFGATAATNVVVVSGTQITATTPSGNAGAVTVKVTVSGQSGSLTNGFSYIGPSPTVSNVSPNAGATAGGTAVTITGTNFAAGASVTFGATAATNVVVVNATTITATTPAGVGAVTVTVTVNGQSGSLTNGFTYTAAPSVSSVSPNTGSTVGGTPITITGTNFAAGATVTFGGSAASNVVVLSSTTITATTPAGSGGGVTVTVTVSGQSGSLTAGFTYSVLPIVSGVSPNSGPTAGGTVVTITGTNFAAGATVTFSGTAATNVVVVSGTQITATTPAGTGAATVAVTLNGQSGSLTNAYTYVGAQTPTSPSNLTAATGGPVPIVSASQTYLNEVAFPSHTTAAFDSTGGDLIVLLGSSHWGVGLTPSDSFGNNWISIAGPTSTSLGWDLRTQIWYARNPIVGPGHTITMNLSESMPLDMAVIVVSGSNISSPIDAISLIGSDNGTYTVNAASPNITTTSMNDLLLGFVKVDNVATFQSGPSFTQQASLYNFDAESAPAAIPGTYNATFTLSQGQTWESAVVAVANNPNQTSLSWTASTETGGTISQYLVERCQGAGCNSFVQIGTTTTTSYNDKGLTASTSYSYRVRAQDTNNNIGPYSSVVNVPTPAPTASLPGNLVAVSPSNTEIDLSWAASMETGGAISQYLVERCQSANCTNFAEIGTSVGTAYYNTGLTSGDIYNYRVQSQDAAGNLSPNSNVASATAVTPDTQPPTAPSNLIASPGTNGQINLSWTGSTDNVGVTGYWIERCQTANCAFYRVAVSTGTTYSDDAPDSNGLELGVSYSYQVQATDAAGNLSPASNISSATSQSGGSSFTLSASPASLGVAPGNLVTSTITTTISGAFNSSITLSASGLPSGATASFNPATIATPGTGNSTMTITVGSGTALGTYSITVTGNGGGVQQSATVTITIGTAFISYVQGNFATPQTSQSTVSVTFTAAQAAGDLNVVAVGWNNSTSTISAVTDKSGNTYTLAVGPTAISGVASQSIYYAKNIAAAAPGANIVTVTFSSAAPAPDIRILEYGGASPTNPVDVTVAGSGTSATSSSGSVTTTNANDLLFGANYVQSLTSGAGSGFTQRMLTTPDGDITEDEMVTTTGSYAATAPVSSGQWIMQMIAFRAQ